MLRIFSGILRTASGFYHFQWGAGARSSVQAHNRPHLSRSASPSIIITSLSSKKSYSDLSYLTIFRP